MAMSVSGHSRHSRRVRFAPKSGHSANARDQGWLESNPVLARMRRVEEQRQPITLPRQEDIALVVERAPGRTSCCGHSATTWTMSGGN
jgi:hypothetical protein